MAPLQAPVAVLRVTSVSRPVALEGMGEFVKEDRADS